MTDYVLSLDLGQAADYSAMAVLHRVWWRKDERPDPDTARLWHQVPTLVRWPLGTSYLQIVQDVYETYQRFEAEYMQWGISLVVDAGGPGRPVIDMLKERRLRPAGVTITGGDLPHDREDGTLTCPKRDICSALVVAVQSKDLLIAREGQEEVIEEFERELLTFGYKPKGRGQKPAYESLEEDVHDDVVLAVAMGLWFSTQRLPKMFPGWKDRGPTVEDMDYDPFGAN